MTTDGSFIKNLDKENANHEAALLILKILLSEKQAQREPAEQLVQRFSFEEVFRLAKYNNVFMRLTEALKVAGQETFLERSNSVLSEEKKRCDRSLDLIRTVSKDFEADQIAYCIIKTLDNYPDFGNDVDIYFDEAFETVREYVFKKYKGIPQKRKVSEYLCGKQSFKIPQWPLLEIHCRKTGQVGEHKMLAERLVLNRVTKSVNGISTYIYSPVDTLLYIVIHRLYRHLYFKAADLINSCALLKNSSFNQEEFLDIAGQLGITQGVGYLLGLLQGIYKDLFGADLLTGQMREAADHKAKLCYKKNFFRIQLLRIPPRLFILEFAAYAKKGKWDSVSRLLTVPPLSLIAYTSIKLFNDDWVW
jgi:hypothetical protein